MFRANDFQAMMGISLMVFEGINQALPILHNCREDVVPHFPKILIGGIATVYVTYIIFGTILYLNLKAHFLYQLSVLKTEVLQLLLNFAIIVSFTLSYPIVVYPFQIILKYWIGLKDKRNQLTTC